MIAHDNEDDLIHSFNLKSEFFIEDREMVQVDQVKQGQINEGLNLNTWVVEHTKSDEDVTRST